MPVYAKVEIFVAVIFISIIAISFTDLNIEAITGYAPIDLYNQKIDIFLAESHTYTLSSGGGDPLKIKSLRFSGEVIGEGQVEIVVADSRDQTLAYSNAKKVYGPSPITGLSVSEEVNSIEGHWLMLDKGEKYVGGWLKELSDGEAFATGKFSKSCFNTCWIYMEMSGKNSYDLIFKVQPGTTLHVTDIFYSVEE